MNEALAMSKGVQQTPALAATLRRAMVYAQQRSHRYVTLEHLLLSLCDDQDALAMMMALGVDVNLLKTQAADVVNRRLSMLHAPGTHDLRPSYKLERVLQAASEDAGRSSPAVVDGAFVLAALASETDSLAAGLLRNQGLTFQQAMSWLLTKRSSQTAPSSRSDPPPPPRPERAAGIAMNGDALEPRLEDMLSTARDILDQEERIRRGGRQAAPAPQRSPSPQPSAPPRGEPRPSPRAMPSAEAAMRPAAKAAQPMRDAPPPPPPPHARLRDRSLTKKLRGVKPADAPAEAVAPTIRNLPAVRADAGKLVETIPRRMRTGKPETIEVRISREHTAALFHGFDGRGKPEAHDIIVTRAMTMMLRAPDGGFIIETLSPETQWVFDRPSFLETERFGRWRWTVTPTAAGKRKLRLIVAARSVDENGMAGDSSLPDQIVEVRVSVNYARAAGRVMRWAFLIVAGAVLGKTAEIFLPGILAALR
jgi:hypothetical protein